MRACDRSSQQRVMKMVQWNTSTFFFLIKNPFSRGCIPPSYQIQLCSFESCCYWVWIYFCFLVCLHFLGYLTVSGLCLWKSRCSVTMFGLPELHPQNRGIFLINIIYPLIVPSTKITTILVVRPYLHTFERLF